jgi:hypothetical protein
MLGQRVNHSLHNNTRKGATLSQTVAHISKQSVFAAILICSESGFKHLSVMYTYAVN